MIRHLAAALVLGALALGAQAQQPELVFAVTEGVTYQATPKEIRDKFAPIAQVIATATGRRVRTVLVPAYDDARAGLKTQEFDVAFVHPAHIPMAEIKAGRYKAIAWTQGFTEYTASMLMNANQPLKSMEDLKGHTVVTPDPDSITSWMVRAMFRTDRIQTTDAREPSPSTVRVITTRYQDAVPFYLEYNFAQVGVTASNAVVKSWTDKGGKVVLRSRAVPIKQFIASNRLSADDRENIREALLTLAQTDPCRRALAASGYKGFVAPDAVRRRFAYRAGAIPESIERLTRARWDRLHHGVERIGFVAYDRVRREEIVGHSAQCDLGLVEAARGAAALPFVFPVIECAAWGRRLKLADDTTILLIEAAAAGAGASEDGEEDA